VTGFVAPRRDVLIQHDVEVPMRDGVVLRANVYRPADDDRYPVLLSRQPYNKDLNINLMYADPVRLAAHGYSRELVARLQAVGATVAYLEIAGADHVWRGAPSVPEIVGASLAFVEKAF
jgi:X-Pro dipeptidyl-peptidase (S15 family)